MVWLLYGYEGASGGFDISQEALSKFVGEIFREAWRNGARLVVIVNGHGGNTPALDYIAREISGKCRSSCYSGRLAEGHGGGD